MYLMPISYSLHYKVAFDIKDVGSNGISKVRHEIKEWLKTHPALRKYNKTLSQSWYEFGDTKQINLGDSYLRVGVNKGDQSEANPENWVLEFIHPDSEFLSRIWCTEIGLSRIDDNSIRLACMLKHAVYEGWIGELPPPPNFSVPRFIKNIITSHKCYKEKTNIQTNINQCLVGNPESLAKEILCKDRILPFVVAAPDDKGNDPVDLHSLQQIVIGNANTYYLPHKNISEFNKFIPEQLSIRPGMVRVYFKMYSSDNNSRRHRYYTKYKIEEIGNEQLLDQIGIALSRNSKTFTTSEIIRIRDVINIRSLFQLNQLKKNHNTNDNEYIKLLEEENYRLTKELDKKDNDISTIISIHDELDNELSSTRAKLFTLQHSLPKQQDGIDVSILSEIPSDIYGCLSTMGDIFKDNIIIHENAYDTAKNFSGNDNINCIKTSWKMLFHISNTLHQLVFSTRKYDLETEFQKRTGIEFSMTEGKQTKKDKKLTQARVCEYNGKKYEFFAHLKGKKNDGYMRIYIAFDNDLKKIIICHCGEHLDTSGTRKLN